MCNHTDATIKINVYPEELSKVDVLEITCMECKEHINADNLKEVFRNELVKNIETMRNQVMKSTKAINWNYMIYDKDGVVL